jgi:hypothetical protein
MEAVTLQAPHPKRLCPYDQYRDRAAGRLEVDEMQANSRIKISAVCQNSRGCL